MTQAHILIKKATDTLNPHGQGKWSQLREVSVEHEKKEKKKKKKGLTVTLVPDNNTRTAHYAVVSV